MDWDSESRKEQGRKATLTVAVYRLSCPISQAPDWGLALIQKPPKPTCSLIRVAGRKKKQKNRKSQVQAKESKKYN